jgi:cytochrome c
MIKSVLTPAFSLVAVSVAVAQGETAKGEKVFDMCRHCHIADTATNRVGPYLKGVVGRKAAIAEGYHFSAAMEAKGDAGLVWTEGNLDAYLAFPQGFIPHNKMLFGGIKNPEDRANIIAYLNPAHGLFASHRRRGPYK